MADELADRKLLAQSREDEAKALAQYEIGPHLFAVADKGRRRAHYVLNNPRFSFDVGRGANIPLAYAKIASSWRKPRTRRRIARTPRSWPGLQEHLSLHPLDTLSRELLADIAALKAQSSPATANRYLALIRAILRRARDEWSWLERIPKISLYKEPKRRVRWLTHEQAGRLLEELPPHQRDLVLFALATGLR